ncbi:hypothetical protein O181_063054 [Austropuccinia psidii MF-1]|uniref:Uncharacterized protein n=1 Tax=Austropuccinia psidii MF-1 TaxID=1389203 RepID=A0A9Q3ELM9_9BASI|nr:hypothetical protein [Austropuccinia psidii MF-1]
MGRDYANGYEAEANPHLLASGFSAQAVISIAQQLCNSNDQQASMSIMTPKQTSAIGQPKIMLYSLFIQPLKPLCRIHHPAIMLVCSPRSPVTKCTMCFSHGAFEDCTHHAHSTRPSQKPSWVIRWLIEETKGI